MWRFLLRTEKGLRMHMVKRELSLSNLEFIFFINFTFAGRSLVIKLLRKTAKSSFLTLHYYEYYVYHRQDIYKLNCDRQLNTSYFRLSIIMNHLLLVLCFMTSVVSTTLYCPKNHTLSAQGLLLRAPTTQLH